MQVVPVATKPCLRAAAEIPAERALLPGIPEAGTIEIPLTIENLSHVPAQWPFLCVTDLGFNIHPVRGGRVERISADGRRLTRFSLETASVLKPGDRLTICRLTATWRGSQSTMVSYDLGPGIAIESLRDLRILCVSGAANFPSERSHLTLAADSIRHAVEAQFTEPSSKSFAPPGLLAQRA